MDPALNSIPLPPPDEIFTAVKSSCRRCRHQAGLIIDMQAIHSFLTDLNNQELLWSQLSLNHGTKLPPRFDNFVQEVNLIAIFGLLNFCSGYRVELKRLTGRGAFDTIRALVIALHISQSDLSAKGLEKVSDHDIANIAQLPLTEDVPHLDLPGVQIGQPTKLVGMVEKITRVLRTTGSVLSRGGYQSLGTFVIECAKKSRVGNSVSGSRFIHRIVEAIPSFRDMTIIDENPVYLFKKVQLLVLDLHTRFSESHPELFQFYDIECLSIFSDNVIPTILNFLKIIPLSIASDSTPTQMDIIKALQEDLRTGRDTSTERSFIFRAAAVDACEIIVQLARTLPRANTFIKNIRAEQLDAYLWRLAKKDAAARNIIRFNDRNTVYF